MVLNYIWVTFFVIAFVIAVVKLVFFGDDKKLSKIMYISTIIDGIMIF